MPKSKDCPSFNTLGEDIKQARKVMGLSRKDLAEKVNIDPRYLANIENSGSLPSLPILYELVKICKLPVERYFFPEADNAGTELRKRTSHKLNLCPEQFLPIIEGAIDGAIKIGEAEDL